ERVDAGDGGSVRHRVRVGGGDLVGAAVSTGLGQVEDVVLVAARIHAGDGRRVTPGIGERDVRQGHVARVADGEHVGYRVAHMGQGGAVVGEADGRMDRVQLVV